MLNPFDRSILIAVPPCLAEKDEDDIIRAFDKAWTALFPARIPAAAA